MKLSKLYCNDSRFHSIEFNPGMNVVLGKVTRRYDRERDSHNLGKSTLVDLLDFMLLKDIDAKHIFRRFRDLFASHVFYLEIIIPEGRFLTIRRSVAEPSKVSFKVTETSTQCGDLTTWDEDSSSFKKAVEYLNNAMGFDILKNYSYRKTVTFFLRGQKDYNSVFQLGKYMNGKHRDWKPFVFELLGYDPTCLTKKYDLDDSLLETETTIKKISTEMAICADDYDRVKSAIEIKQVELDEMKQRIDSFNFYAEERQLNRGLVEDIERQIAELNTQEYALTYDLEKMHGSIENIPMFDVEQLKEIYEEVKVFFPDNMTKGYEDLVEFNRKVTEERNRYLREQIDTTEKELKLVRENLKRQNERRNDALMALQDKDTFHKFKEYQKRMAVLEGEISKLNLQLENIDTVSKLNESADSMKQQLTVVSKDIANQVKYNSNQDTVKIKKYFNEIFRSIFGVSALLYVNTNKQSNVEFMTEVAPDDEAQATAEGMGNTYKKMLCVAFDLAVLATYSDREFFRFVYHDGVLEGLDNRKKELFLQIAREYCNRYGIQYIFSTIEDDIPLGLLDSFSVTEKCLELNDRDDSGKLFGFSF